MRHQVHGTLILERTDLVVRRGGTFRFGCGSSLILRDGSRMVK